MGRVQRLSLVVLAGLSLAAAAFLGSVLWQLWRGGAEGALLATQTALPKAGVENRAGTGMEKTVAVRPPQEYASARSGWIFKRPWQRMNPAPVEDASGAAIPQASPAPYQSNYVVKGILFGAGPPVVALAEKSTGRIFNATVGETVGDEEVVLIRASFAILRRGDQEVRLELP